MYKTLEINEYETVEVYATRCGKIIETSFICCKACNKNCLGYKNLMDEIL